MQSLQISFIFTLDPDVDLAHTRVVGHIWEPAFAEVDVHGCAVAVVSFLWSDELQPGVVVAVATGEAEAEFGGVECYGGWDGGDGDGGGYAAVFEWHFEVLFVVLHG